MEFTMTDRKNFKLALVFIWTLAVVSLVLSVKL